ncbi:hypothetical protein [Oceanibaculum indicum]|uniref:Uncharacterized protein n=1 Tax=Oceanibaculum indicum P24 TaxID=1207063 RepID=K2J5U7_9PROT|nr:hypothetical protein [Oceanibaculum indicum]EKE78456.1 hypothetical protein P24_02811 [Oceanibaculum indicum P24]
MIQLVRTPIIRRAPVLLASADPAAATVGFQATGYVYEAVEIEIGLSDRHRYLLRAPMTAWDRLCLRVEEVVQGDALRRLRAEDAKAGAA